MSDTRWNIPTGKTVIPEELTKAGYTPLLAAVLNVRGMKTAEDARSFLENDESLLGDPCMLADMPMAVRRLQRAIDAKEKVAVYGDYDVDGITSSCMLTDYLRGRGLDCELYIPNRLDEGYGVNKEAIRTLGESGVSLIITVDCGVTTVEEADYASENGIDMIITDHHECRDELPEAAAVVDPKRSDCNYPSQDLAGVGVAFKLLCALEGSAEPMLKRYADLVAVGTIADVMPLVGENRYIVKRGLEKLQNDPRPGFRALIEESGLGEKKITATNVGFTLAPRLNASGRLGQVETAVELLLADTRAKAVGHAEKLCNLNRDRQALETDIWQQAKDMLGSETPTAPIVLADEGWHQGVIGIAASRLTEAYGVPAIMICLDGDKGKGSCRSCGGFNLFEALSACSDYLEGFGGHTLAAGLTIKKENIDGFRAAMAEYYAAHPADGVATLDIDLCVDRPELLSMSCIEDLARIEPCGAGNFRPQLCLLGAELVDLVSIGGGRHLRLQLSKFGQVFEAVFFNHTAEQLGLRIGSCVDAAFYPQINEFRGRRSVQLLMNELRAHDASGAADILNDEAPDRFAGFLPSRCDFAQVWRALSGRGGCVTAPTERFADALCPTLREETLFLCLKVFEELGLAELRVTDGGQLTAACKQGRAELDASVLLTRLREAAKQAEKEG